MQVLDKITASRIVNLKSSPLISDAIAERQLQVIMRGYNYLSQPSNNVLYIADEVGLGKTYIALGIASLLRHFSTDPASYQDMIVVPKENLQHKWEKEIKQFISRNYQLFDNRVKSVIGTPIAAIYKKESLAPINHDYPAYHLYRNSQFSFGLNKEDGSAKAQFHKLRERLTDANAIEILEVAERIGYFYAANRGRLKRLYAYLLSLCNPEIELLIVDEGHNFKQGMGASDDDEVSDRNNVISRFLGIKRNSEEDKQIFRDFPQLTKLVCPKVQKLIVLSATPKTENLLELKHQLDCFLPNHILSSLKEEHIKDKLPQFLIRGNMEYSVAGKSYTRNLCRLEHRKGNVKKSVEPIPLSLNNEEAIVLGLMQYNTIKHLDAKHNATFELGMLAGFETFRIDQEKRATAKEQVEKKSEGEYEEVRSRKTKSSQDYDVLKNILASYKQTFGELPPHPKQNAIVQAAVEMMKKGEKSLIFVRRVASAYELERRLLDEWEKLIAEEIEGKWMRRLGSSALKELLFSYKQYKNDRELVEKLDDIFGRVVEKYGSSKSQYSFSYLDEHFQGQQAKVLLVGLNYLFNQYSNVENGEQWYQLLSRHANLSVIKSELLESTYELLQKTYGNWSSLIESNDDEEDEVEDSYFFHRYFFKPHIKPFKKRLYNTDWFDVNFFLLNEHFLIANFSAIPLQKDDIHALDDNDLKEVQEIFLKYIEDAPYVEQKLDRANYPDVLITHSTLLTEVLIKGCRKELLQFFEEQKDKKRSAVFGELKTLFTIIKGCLRNGSGFLPLYIADKADGDTVKNYLQLIGDEDSLFHYVLREVRTIIQDYALLRAVNFPEGDKQKQIETKLYNQTPVVGLTGQSTRSKSNVAAQFRMPGFPYVMVTTDIFREGEDLHTYCQNIYHYGIAWNCSDMEQRTGRIDRINSISHRKMSNSGAITFDERIHVFYPYLQQTLEVNQVSKLFRSINTFVETFNDFTKPIKEDGIALTREKVEHILPVIEVPLHSKFEYHYFKGYNEGGESKLEQACIGTQEVELLSVLKSIKDGLEVSGERYHYGPTLDKQSWNLKGDMKITSRNDRRGPFVIQLKNDERPGYFMLEVASHLYKMSNKLRKASKELVEQNGVQYNLIQIDDFYALCYSFPVGGYDQQGFIAQLKELIIVADEIEEQLMKGKDEIVFG